MSNQNIIQACKYRLGKRILDSSFMKSSYGYATFLTYYEKLFFLHINNLFLFVIFYFIYYISLNIKKRVRIESDCKIVWNE